MKLARLCRSTLLSCIPIIGCLNTDFGRVRPSLVEDDIHAWVGAKANLAEGKVPSAFPLTDDERLLRDLAYPLIAPPYDRVRWSSVIEEYGLTERISPDIIYDVDNYTNALFADPTRSTLTLYARLNDDVRNDVQRAGAFFVTLHRVLDMDRKRGESLKYIAVLEKHELVNAKRRIAENALIGDWTRRALKERIASYRFALERLVIVAPSQEAVMVERSITLLKTQVFGIPAPSVADVAVKKPLVVKD